MSDFDFSKNSTDDRVLIISFINSKPINARNLASILRALSIDYHKMTGRDLVLGRMEMGSIWLWLMDAAVTTGVVIKEGADIAKATESLGLFAKKLKGAFSPNANKGGGQVITVADASVEKSIIAIARVSEETKSIIHMKKTLSTNIGVETLEVTITPAQAKEARNRVRSKSDLTLESIKQSSPAEDHTIIDTIRSFAHDSDDVDSIIRAIVQAHIMNGTTSVLDDVVIKLEGEGRFDLAQRIRQIIYDKDNHTRDEV